MNSFRERIILARLRGCVYAFEQCVHHKNACAICWQRGYKSCPHWRRLHQEFSDAFKKALEQSFDEIEKIEEQTITFADGKIFLRCPSCGTVGIVDDEQYHGKAPVVCYYCGYRDVHDWSKEPKKEGGEA